MLEIGWSEILVIALILIIVVGPKDLPGMLRNFGRMATRVRGMANEFKGQFDQALREAELDDVRQGLNEVKKLNPTNSLRDAINPIRKFGEDLKSDMKKASESVEKSMQPSPAIVTDETDIYSDPPQTAAEPVVPAAGVDLVKPAIAPAATPVQTPLDTAAPAKLADVPVSTVPTPVSAEVKPARKKAVAPATTAGTVAVTEVKPARKAPTRKKADVAPVDAAEISDSTEKPATATRRKKPAKAGDA